MKHCTCPIPAGSPHDPGCPAVTGALTFAEAMALDPGDVEMQCAEEHCWTSLTKLESLKLSIARDRKFRRVRPARTRVQEMAETLLKEGKLGVIEPLTDSAMNHAIRAVCEFLRTAGYNMPHHAAAFATDIERKFLEPR